MGDRTKIEWATASWNPITGCKHDCKYCYARRIAARFGSHQRSEENQVLDKPVRCSDTYDYMKLAGISAGAVQPYPYDFTPTFHRYRLDEPMHWRKQRTIFVCSMADMFGDWVPDSWISDVLDACRAAPQHRYLFLTKNPARYIKLAESGVLRPEDANMWFGSSVPTEDTVYFWSDELNTFLSIEPLHSDFERGGFRGINWIIIGAETGNRKGKVVPKKEWVEHICESADIMGVPVFMKDSLIPVIGEEGMRREFPLGGG